jgi:hypothetical protein
MGKRGRKPSEYRKGYFYEKEEDAVINYIKAESSEEKNLIFEQYLRPALEKMIEIIIRRYKLYQKGEEFNETFDDALAFIITKIDRYKQENGRAFSYIQTVCKHHLIGKLNESKKLTIRNISYDDLSEEINESEKFSYTIHDEESEASGVISATIREINNTIETDKKLNKNEIMVGKALSEILQNWDELFTDLGSNKFNKSSILLYIKETTNLPTKDIRNAMRKFKLVYFKTKDLML